MAAVVEKIEKIKPELRELVKTYLYELSEICDHGNGPIGGYSIFTEHHGEIFHPYLDINIVVLHDKKIKTTVEYLGLKPLVNEYTIDELVNAMSVDMMENVAQFLLKNYHKTLGSIHKPSKETSK